MREYVLPIAIAFLFAWLIHRLSGRIAGRFVRMSDYVPEGMRLRQERLRTLHDLLASGISFTAFLIAGLFTLARFVDTNTLIWMIGLFSAAFGLGARPLISDFLTGIGFMFEDTFDVGEKVEIISGISIEGVVERINLRTTLLRAPTGELYVIPNGEMRIIRNFSRSRFSPSNITLKLATTDLTEAIEILEQLSHEALTLLPNLLEPWQILNTSGIAGQEVELTVVAKARFGKAAEMRPYLLALIQERLAQANITLKAL